MKGKTVARLKLAGLPLIALLLLALPGNARSARKHTAVGSSRPAKQGMQMPMIKGRVMGMSKYNFDETVSKITAAIEAHQMMHLFTADHQQMLSMVGLKTPPMETLEFFSPRYGKTIYQEDMAGALAVPLRIIIMRNEQGMVMYAYDKPSYLFARFSKLADLGRQLDQVMEEIVSSVKAPMKM